VTEHPQAPGWSLASDGRWYPPPPTPPNRSKTPWVVLLLALGALVAAVVGVVVFAADDDEAATTSTSTAATEVGLDIEVPDGFAPIVNEVEGFAIAVPEDWEEFDLSEAGAEEVLDELAEDNPELGAVYDQARSVIESGGQFFAADPVTGSNLVIIKTPGEVNIALVVESVAGVLESLGATNITSEIVPVPTGLAVHVEYDVPINQPDDSTLVAHGVQYQVPAAGSTWTVTFTTDDMARDREIIDQMAQSFAVAE
jgi:hypothetical protein